METIEKINMQLFVESYLTTAAWVTVDSSSECSEFTKEGKAIALKDCEKFILAVVEKMGYNKAMQVLSIDGKDVSYLSAHDFFLTRCGHGTGFWDKEVFYGESEAKILTEISKKIGNVDCIHVRGVKSKLTFY